MTGTAGEMLSQSRQYRNSQQSKKGRQEYFVSHFQSINVKLKILSPEWRLMEGGVGNIKATFKVEAKQNRIKYTQFCKKQ